VFSTGSSAVEKDGL